MFFFSIMAQGNVRRHTVIYVAFKFAEDTLCEFAQRTVYVDTRGILQHGPRISCHHRNCDKTDLLTALLTLSYLLAHEVSVGSQYQDISDASIDEYFQND